MEWKGNMSQERRNLDFASQKPRRNFMPESLGYEINSFKRNLSLEKLTTYAFQAVGSRQRGATSAWCNVSVVQRQRGATRANSPKRLELPDETRSNRKRFVEFDQSRRG
ncbi:hypothetical protein LAZ67_2005886 [Cordylochernes scorpioides]|uniref:Uncharacterized protein n=1 Tax=Cordylochernes scorpioides TaxID=51811 RepID=A0ABY6K9F3_9ARAC|nr:hypothetical protein LAZ67_2005886 [Cordylochernes scorpioides]